MTMRSTQRTAAPEICLIYARAANGVIGRDNAIPWHLPQDMAHFKALTAGQPVVMGRRTWDSLPPRFRPLPGRRNIVLTRQENWNENGAQRATGLREALSFCEHDARVWIIGGALVYAEALPLASRVEVTELEADHDGDAYAPELPASEWQVTHREAHTADDGQRFEFVRYERRRDVAIDPVESRLLSNSQVDGGHSQSPD